MYRPRKRTVRHFVPKSFIDSWIKMFDEFVKLSIIGLVAISKLNLLEPKNEHVLSIVFLAFIIIFGSLFSLVLRKYIQITYGEE